MVPLVEMSTLRCFLMEKNADTALVVAIYLEQVECCLDDVIAGPIHLQVGRNLANHEVEHH